MTPDPSITIGDQTPRAEVLPPPPPGRLIETVHVRPDQRPPHTGDEYARHGQHLGRIVAVQRIGRDEYRVEVELRRDW